VEDANIIGPPAVRAGRQPERAVVALRQVRIMCAAELQFLLGSTGAHSRRRSLRAGVNELRCPGAPSTLASAWAAAECG
jgi:hypothetical protein